MTSPSDSPSYRHVVLYDGECGLCSRLVQFILARDAAGLFGFATLQGPVASRLLGQAQVSVDRLIVVRDVGSDRQAILDRSDAALFIARHLGQPWRACSVLRVVPRVLRDLVYRGIAALRHRLWPSNASCSVPRLEHRDRFLD